MAEMVLMASLGFLVIPAFLVQSGLRGLQGSVTPQPVKEPCWEGAGKSRVLGAREGEPEEVRSAGGSLSKRL